MQSKTIDSFHFNFFLRLTHRQSERRQGKRQIKSVWFVSIDINITEDELFLPLSERHMHFFRGTFISRIRETQAKHSFNINLTVLRRHLFFLRLTLSETFQLYELPVFFSLSPNEIHFISFKNKRFYVFFSLHFTKNSFFKRIIKHMLFFIIFFSFPWGSYSLVFK